MHSPVLIAIYAFCITFAFSLCRVITSDVGLSVTLPAPLPHRPSMLSNPLKILHKHESLLIRDRANPHTFAHPNMPWGPVNLKGDSKETGVVFITQ